MLLDLQYLLFIFFRFSIYCIYCYAPKQQGKFLVCENLLGHKPDSDFNLSHCDQQMCLQNQSVIWVDFLTVSIKKVFFNVIAVKNLIDNGGIASQLNYYFSGLSSH